MKVEKLKNATHEFLNTHQTKFEFLKKTAEGITKNLTHIPFERNAQLKLYKEILAFASEVEKFNSEILELKSEVDEINDGVVFEVNVAVENINKNLDALFTVLATFIVKDKREIETLINYQDKNSNSLKIAAIKDLLRNGSRDDVSKARKLFNSLNFSFTSGQELIETLTPLMSLEPKQINSLLVTNRVTNVSFSATSTIGFSEGSTYEEFKGVSQNYAYYIGALLNYKVSPKVAIEYLLKINWEDESFQMPHLSNFSLTLTNEQMLAFVNDASFCKLISKSDYVAGLSLKFLLNLISNKADKDANLIELATKLASVITTNAKPAYQKTAFKQLTSAVVAKLPMATLESFTDITTTSEEISGRIYDAAKYLAIKAQAPADKEKVKELFVFLANFGCGKIKDFANYHCAVNAYSYTDAYTFDTTVRHSAIKSKQLSYLESVENYDSLAEIEPTSRLSLGTIDKLIAAENNDKIFDLLLNELANNIAVDSATVQQILGKIQAKPSPWLSVEQKAKLKYIQFLLKFQKKYQDSDLHSFFVKGKLDQVGVKSLSEFFEHIDVAELADVDPLSIRKLINWLNIFDAEATLLMLHVFFSAKQIGLAKSLWSSNFVVEEQLANLNYSDLEKITKVLVDIHGIDILSFIKDIFVKYLVVRNKSNVSLRSIIAGIERLLDGLKDYLCAKYGQDCYDKLYNEVLLGVLKSPIITSKEDILKRIFSRTDDKDEFYRQYFSDFKRLSFLLDSVGDQFKLEAQVDSGADDNKLKLITYLFNRKHGLPDMEFTLRQFLTDLLLSADESSIVYFVKNLELSAIDTIANKLIPGVTVGRFFNALLLTRPEYFGNADIVPAFLQADKQDSKSSKKKSELLACLIDAPGALVSFSDKNIQSIAEPLLDILSQEAVSHPEKVKDIGLGLVARIDTLSAKQVRRLLDCMLKIEAEGAVKHIVNHLNSNLSSYGADIPEEFSISFAEKGFIKYDDFGKWFESANINLSDWVSKLKSCPTEQLNAVFYFNLLKYIATQMTDRLSDDDIIALFNELDFKHKEEFLAVLNDHYMNNSKLLDVVRLLMSNDCLSGENFPILLKMLNAQDENILQSAITIPSSRNRQLFSVETAYKLLSQHANDLYLDFVPAIFVCLDSAYINAIFMQYFIEKHEGAQASNEFIVCLRDCFLEIKSFEDLSVKEQLRRYNSLTRDKNSEDLIIYIESLLNKGMRPEFIAGLCSRLESADLYKRVLAKDTLSNNIKSALAREILLENLLKLNDGNDLRQIDLSKDDIDNVKFLISLLLPTDWFVLVAKFESGLYRFSENTIKEMHGYLKAQILSDACFADLRKLFAGKAVSKELLKFCLSDFDIVKAMLEDATMSKSLSDHYVVDILTRKTFTTHVLEGKEGFIDTLANMLVQYSNAGKISLHDRKDIISTCYEIKKPGTQKIAESQFTALLELISEQNKGNAEFSSLLKDILSDKRYIALVLGKYHSVILEKINYINTAVKKRIYSSIDSFCHTVEDKQRLFNLKAKDDDYKRIRLLSEFLSDSDLVEKSEPEYITKIINRSCSSMVGNTPSEIFEHVAGLIIASIVNPSNKVKVAKALFNSNAWPNFGKELAMDVIESADFRREDLGDLFEAVSKTSAEHSSSEGHLMAYIIEWDGDKAASSSSIRHLNEMFEAKDQPKLSYVSNGINEWLGDEPVDNVKSAVKKLNGYEKATDLIELAKKAIERNDKLSWFGKTSRKIKLTLLEFSLFIGITKLEESVVQAKAPVTPIGSSTAVIAKGTPAIKKPRKVAFTATSFAASEVIGSGYAHPIKHEAPKANPQEKESVPEDQEKEGEKLAARNNMHA